MRPYSMHGHGANGQPIYKTGPGAPSKRSQVMHNVKMEGNVVRGLAAKNDNGGRGALALNNGSGKNHPHSVV